jgi:hypothetical protein
VLWIAAAVAWTANAARRGKVDIGHIVAICYGVGCGVIAILWFLLVVH